MMQPIITDKHGTKRFKKNEIVARLLEEGGIGLNDIALWDVSKEDRRQFAQLIGYSVSGYGGLDYVDDASYCAAERVAIDEQADPKDAEIASLREQLRDARRGMRRGVAALFECHPDNLESDS